MMIAAVRPQRTSVIENSALSAAITTSQAEMIPVPPPKQPPCTNATVGIGSVLSRCTASKVARHRLVLLGRFRPHAVDPFQVGTGLKMLAVALQDHDAEMRFLAQFIHRRQHAVDEAGVIGVVHLGAIERDGCDAALIEIP